MAGASARSRSIHAPHPLPVRACGVRGTRQLALRAERRHRRRAGRRLPRRGAGRVSAAWYPHGLESLTPDTSMAETLKRLGARVAVGGLAEPSRYIAPRSLSYTLDGVPRRWDMVESHPSVAALLYHAGRDAALIVRQFRPAVYATVAREAAGAAARAGRAGGGDPPGLAVGFTYELCAGLVDKPDLTLEEVAREEILEECGFDVPVQGLAPVNAYLSAIGISGARQTIFAARVTDAMAVGGAGGLRHQGEAIEVLALPVANIPAFLADQSLGKSAGLLYALGWLQAALKAGRI